MKNIGVKTIILGLVITVAVAGVLVFYPTIVAPPVDVPVSNLHKSTLDADIRGFSESETWNYNDSLYNVVVDKIALYKSENFITKGEADSKTNALVQSYVPVFYELCYDKFEASVWYESDHTAMRDRITELRNLKIDNGMSNAVSGSCETSLAGIEKIITDYNKAKSLIASSYSFESVKDAEEDIKEADKYLETKPLINCTELGEQLGNVRKNLANAHYNAVDKQINELANYRKMTEDDYKKLEKDVEKIIETYEETSIYGSNNKPNATPLSNKAIIYAGKAFDYYNREQIKLDTTYPNQWISMYSPDDHYNAYMSDSNWYVNGKDATICFLIRGYSDFTFYIRSNGESYYDYVIVQKNNAPTTSNNYSNTYGNANSGTSLSNYNKVTFNSLEKTETYKIYVVYHKNSTNSVNDDRGYVLVPKPTPYTD